MPVQATRALSTAGGSVATGSPARPPSTSCQGRNPWPSHVWDWVWRRLAWRYQTMPPPCSSMRRGGSCWVREVRRRDIPARSATGSPTCAGVHPTNRSLLRNAAARRTPRAYSVVGRLTDASAPAVDRALSSAKRGRQHRSCGGRTGISHDGEEMLSRCFACFGMRLVAHNVRSSRLRQVQQECGRTPWRRCCLGVQPGDHR